MNNKNNKYYSYYKIKDTKLFTNKFVFTKGLLLALPYIFITLLFVIIPLIVILINAFTPSTGNINDN